MTTKTYEIPKEIVLSVGDKKRIFPTVWDPKSASKSAFVDYQKLRITDIALYSTTPPDQSRFMCDILEKIYSPKKLSQMALTDANGCIGGNTFYFSRVMRWVNFVEISPLHMEIFKNNAHILIPRAKNVSLYLANYLDMYDKIKQEIIFLDPPWGGPNYYQQVDLELYYTDSNGKYVSLSDFIKLRLQSLADTIIVKVPKNYNVALLDRNSGFSHCKIIKFLKPKGILYLLIVLSNQKSIEDLPSEYHVRPIGYKSMHYTVI